MSDVKYTAGPWSLGAVAAVQPGTRGNLFHVWRSQPKPYSEWVATVFDGGPISCFEGDARLIAAAPDLLEALKAMLPEANQDEAHCRPSFETCEIARSAIAKAEARP